MSSCARCQSRLPPQARFCSECGAWSAPAAQPIPDAYASTDDAPLASFYAMGPPAVRVRPPSVAPPAPPFVSAPTEIARAEPRSARPTPSTQMHTLTPIDLRAQASAASHADPAASPLIHPPPIAPPIREPAGETSPVLPDRG
ncbi:MAG: hypothetical protein ACHREM_31710, partial [Polyangiales bacterium]